MKLPLNLCIVDTYVGTDIISHGRCFCFCIEIQPNVTNRQNVTVNKGASYSYDCSVESNPIAMLKWRYTEIVEEVRRADARDPNFKRIHEEKIFHS